MSLWVFMSLGLIAGFLGARDKKVFELILPSPPIHRMIRSKKGTRPASHPVQHPQRRVVRSWTQVPTSFSEISDPTTDPYYTALK